MRDGLTPLRSPYWVRDYSSFAPLSSQDCHWGKAQSGFCLSLSGRIWLTDNRAVRGGLHGRRDIDDEFTHPCHRDLVDGRGDDATVYAGIYSFGAEVCLWLYPQAEGALNEAMRAGLKSLIGVHLITATTPVKSNTSRRVLFILGES